MDSIPIKEAKSIAVIRTDHIGDLIVSTPFLRALRQAAPKAVITAIVPEYTAPVLENTSLVSRVLSYSDIKEPGFLKSVAELKADIAICLAPRTAAYRLTYATKAPCRVGYCYANRPLTALMCRLYFLTSTMSVNLQKDIEAGKPIPHEIQQLGEFAKALGIAYPNDSLCFRLSDGEQAKAEKIMASWRRPVIILQLHNNWLTCGWSVENLLQLLHNLFKTAKGGELVICCGPAEHGLAAELREALKRDGETGPESLAPHFFGDLSFRDWAALFSCADFIVTPDTGAVHLASALKKAVVAVYEPKTAVLNTQQWAPWQVAHRIIVKGEAGETVKQITSALEELIIDDLAQQASLAQEEAEGPVGEG